jgi:hypothetical protein
MLALGFHSWLFQAMTCLWQGLGGTFGSSVPQIIGFLNYLEFILQLVVLH